LKRRSFWRGGNRKVPVPKWLVVARNEYRIRINRIRSIRSYFPYLVIGLLAVYVMFIAPALFSFSSMISLLFFLSKVAVAMVPIIMFFFYLILLPITYTARATSSTLWIYVDLHVVCNLSNTEVCG